MSPAKPLLEPDQFARYSRHLRLPEIGVEGQRRLLEARVLLIGAGGLGCPLAQYLAAAGVGVIGLIDFDRVDASNLQRQVLYGTADVGRPKIEVARERIAALNPDVTVETHEVLLSSDNALEILGGYDVVVDGTDNFPTRYLSNDACVLLGKPNVHGSIFRFEGQATVFDANRGPCYRCLYPEPPPPGAVPSCAEGGVLGVLPGLIAMIQATETVKLVTGIGEPLTGRLLQYDALQMEFAEFRLRKDPKCPVCGEQPTVTELIDYEGFCGVSVGAESGVSVTEITAAEARARRDRGQEFLLLDVREPWEVATAHLEGSVSIPLDEIESRLEELADWRQRPIVVHCHHGGRSARGEHGGRHRSLVGHGRPRGPALQRTAQVARGADRHAGRGNGQVENSRAARAPSSGGARTQPGPGASHCRGVPGCGALGGGRRFPAQGGRRRAARSAVDRGPGIGRRLSPAGGRHGHGPGAAAGGMARAGGSGYVRRQRALCCRGQAPGGAGGGLKAWPRARRATTSASR
jgi:adenylyltransferase/sulfurtransferase